ncbi:MAG: septum formation initiator family protein [Oscillospiraceae bacterium]|nr:septum formation initiator family protein [Oscillospiraceae bacterium]
MRLKRTSLTTKLLLLVVAVYALVTLVRLQDRVRTANAEVAALEQQVIYAQQEQLLMEVALRELGTDESIKTIARTRLGMVESGEIVFYDADVQ